MLNAIGEGTSGRRRTTMRPRARADSDSDAGAFSDPEPPGAVEASARGSASNVYGVSGGNDGDGDGDGAVMRPGGAGAAPRLQTLPRDISVDQMDEADRPAAMVSPSDAGIFPARPISSPDDDAATSDVPSPESPLVDNVIAIQNQAGARQAMMMEQNQPQLPPGAPPFSVPSVTLGRRDETIMTVNRPISQGRLQFTRVLRRRESLGSSRVTYELFIEDTNGTLRSALFARRLRGQTSCYIITLSESAERGSRHHTIARVKSNFLGTAFTIYDTGTDPIRAMRSSIVQPISLPSKDTDPASSTADDVSVKSTRKELGAIVYVPNILGRKGPRKMTLIMPPINPGGKPIIIQPLEDKDTLLERHKNGNDHDLLVLHNKSPQWSEETQSYVLNFNGRVALASVKNFQIVHDHDLEYIALQFGRVSEDTFTLDVRFPFSLIQAFGIALTSLDAKLACE